MQLAVTDEAGRPIVSLVAPSYEGWQDGAGDRWREHARIAGRRWFLGGPSREPMPAVSSGDVGAIPSARIRRPLRPRPGLNRLISLGRKLRTAYF